MTAAGVERVLAGNPGPMTLDGTNTWVVHGSRSTVVVDPGPDLPEHLDAVAAAAGHGRVLVLLTHRHADHSDAVAPLARRLGCTARAADPRHCLGAPPLADGERLDLGDRSLTVVGTPGHTSDSVSLLFQAPDGVRLLTGDTVLGRGTSVITHPDGDVGAYLASLHRLLDVANLHRVVALLPGHGPVVTEPTAVLQQYRRHRLARLDEVGAALAAGDRTAAEVVRRVYVDVDRSLWWAAEQSVAAQLEYLRRPTG